MTNLVLPLKKKMINEGFPISIITNKLLSLFSKDKSHTLNLLPSLSNFIALGTSHSSTFQTIVKNWLPKCSRNNNIVIIDGVYLNAAHMNLNPFALFDVMGKTVINGVLTPNYYQIRDLLALMVSPNESITVRQEDYLLQAVISCWKKYGQKSRIEDVLAALREQLNTIELRYISDLIDLIIPLKNYGCDGLYGHLFNHHAVLTSKDVVINIAYFCKQPEIAVVMMSALLITLQGQFYQQGPRNRKLCLVAEPTKYLTHGSNPIAARFIEQCFQTIKTYNTGIGIVAQTSIQTPSLQWKALMKSIENKYIYQKNYCEEYLSNAFHHLFLENAH